MSILSNKNTLLRNYNLSTVDIMGGISFAVDRNGFLKTPDYVLSMASKNKLGTLKAIDKTMSVKFNDIGEIGFKTYRYINGKENKLYDRVLENMYIYTPHTNYYKITSCTIHSENTMNEYKECVAQQTQCNLLNKKLDTFIINMGVPGSVEVAYNEKNNITDIKEMKKVKFYNPLCRELSLMDLVLEKAPEWTFDDSVETDLADLERSFEVDYQDIYSFLTQDVATAFDCLFFFDTINNKISAYKTSTCEKNTNIHISHKNLASNFSIQSSDDDICTYLKLSGADDITVREINMGYDGIYNLDYYFTCLEDGTPKFVTYGLYEAYKKWKVLWDNNIDPYSEQLAIYQNCQVELSNLRYYGEHDGERNLVSEILAIRTDPETKDDVDGYLNGFSLNALNDMLAKIENQMNVYAKMDGYADAKYKTDDKGNEVTDENGKLIPTNEKYINHYQPLVEMKQILKDEIDERQEQIDAYSKEEHKMQIAYNKMQEIQAVIDMNANFTQEQLNELSHFIKESDLSDSNYVITDTMTEEERLEMLNAFLEFAQKELVKKSQPTYQFTATLANLFSLPEFADYAADFKIGSYINVSISDKYRLKVRILGFDISFNDKSNFNVTFGNVMQVKEKNIFTDTTEAITLAQKTAQSVSFNASNWSNGATAASSLSQEIADGLLSAGHSLTDGTESQFVIDKRGIFVNTSDFMADGSVNEHPYDSIYVGGGRILFTDDDWTTVSEAIGRIDIKGKSTFGVIAKAVIAGYIEGGEIVSANINNGNGTFSVDKDGKLIASSATITGTIYADAGYIGGENGFVIDANRIYSNGKSTIDKVDTEGVYIGTAGISLGKAVSGKSSPFKVTSDGKLNATNAIIEGKISATSGRIGSEKNYFTITANDTANYAAIYSGSKSTFASTASGVYVGTNGISLGANNLFNVTSGGVLTAQSGTIGGLEFNDSRIKSSNGNFKVDSDGNVTASSITLTANSGSKFGGITYNSNGTGGSFNYSFNVTGSAEEQFSKLVTDRIDTNYINTKVIDAGTLNGMAVNWQTLSYCYQVDVDSGVHTVDGELMRIVHSVTPHYYTLYSLCAYY